MAEQFKLLDEMGQRMTVGCWSRLLLVTALFVVGECQEKCAMENLKDTCICVNDESCIKKAVEGFNPLDGIPLVQSCTCSHGREYTLEMLASILQNQEETDMVIDSLYMSGVDLISLEPLDRLLVNVSYGIMLLATSINSLEPLSRLESVGHFIIAQNRFLINFRGLLELTTVTGDFIVSRDSALMNFNGLGSLTHILGYLSVTQNKELIRLNVLKNLTNVAGVRIIKNDAFKIVNGFERLVTVGVINIECNHVLTKLTGFKRLKTVAKSLNIIDNRALMNISGFRDLMKVGCFRISGNKALHRIDGFQSIEYASGAISLTSNPDLLDISGFGNLLEVKGDLQIHGNSELRGINGFGNLLRLDGRLFRTKNQNLKNIHGLENLQEVGGAIAIDSGNEGSNLRMSFTNLTTVGGHLWLQNVKLSGGSFEALMEIQGELEMGKGTLDDSGAAQFKNLRNVKGSLKLLSNTVLDSQKNVTIFQNLAHVCSGGQGGRTYDDDMACGMIIKDNVGFKHINVFGKLATLNGTLMITNNVLLSTIDGFGELTSLVSKIRRVGEAEDLFGGLTIAFNRELESITGFQKLTTVDGVLTISQNRALNHINLSRLENVTGITRINANGEKLANFSFESLEPLPFREPGCRIRKSEVSLVNSHDGGPILLTKLQKETCRLKGRFQLW